VDLRAWGKAGFRLEKIWLVVYLPTPLKNMKVSWDDGGSDTFPQPDNGKSPFLNKIGWWF
jgi:hypothetical protein